MAQRDPGARPRRGAIAEPQLDGSVTLYGVEDWTQLHDVPVLKIVQCPRSGDLKSDETGHRIVDTTPDDAIEPPRA